MRWCRVCKHREWDGPDGEPVCANPWCPEIKRLRAEVRRLRRALLDVCGMTYDTDIQVRAERALRRKGTR